MTVEQCNYEEATGYSKGPGGMDLIDWFAGQALASGVIPTDSCYVAAEFLMLARKACLAKLRQQAKENQ